MRFIRRGLSDNEWKAKTIIDVALAGCGQHSEVEDDVEKASRFITLGHITNWREKAMLLAADRSTKFLPISVALLLFNGAFGLAYGRTVSSSEGPDNWIPIELHSVAFSASFLWLTEAVLLSALIGVSQTKTAVSRILNIHEPVHPASRRAASGALPSWQPGMWCTKQRKHDPNIISQWRVVALSCIAAILVASGTFIAWAISFAVPPERFGCRHAAQGAMLGFWIASYASGICLAKVDLSPTVLFALTYLKDALTSAAIIAIIMVTQWGIFNRSICWVGSGGLQLPQAPSVAAQISSRINVDYPCIIFVGIAFQFLACMLIATYYRFAIRVFLQRDDGTSNSPKSLKARSWKPNGGLDLRTLLSRGVSGHEMHVVRRGRKRRASKSDVPIGTEGSSTEKVETGSITNYLK